MDYVLEADINSKTASKLMKTKSQKENSFTWLEELIASVKTNNFFVVDGSASKLLRRAIRDSSIGVPKCYKSFVLQFGNSKLYRSRLQYLVEVFASPHPAKSEAGEDLLQFGKTDDSPAYFKVCELQNDGSEIPVYEWNPEDGLHLAYSGFEEWLIENCKIARRQFKKKRWTMINYQHFDPVIEGMRRVVNEPGGTGKLARLEDIMVCGKTGTVQNPHGEDHSVFFAFAPMNKPKIAIAVFVENAGWGGTWAAPITALMIEKYLKGKISDPDKEKRIMEAKIAYQSSN